MNVRELTFKGEDKTVLYACGKCGIISSPKTYAANAEDQHAAARRAAEECCAPRKCACGDEIEKYWTACEDCRERNMLAKATIIDASSYDGPVSAAVDGDWGDGYSSSLEALIEYCEGYDRPVPAYCHPCTKKTLNIDPTTVLENAVDDMHENAFDEIEGADDLIDFVEKWNARQTCATYYEDRSRVIVIDRDRFDTIRTVEEPAQ